MVETALLGLLLLMSAPVSPQGASSQEADDYSRLLGIKRLCVEKLAGDEAGQAREMAFASLFAAKRFVLTENCEKADAVLKGSVSETREQRLRAEGEGVEFGRAVGVASVSGGSGSAAVGAARGASGENLVSAETLSQASVTLRIVDKEGEVIWAHTEENKGAKTKTPVAFALDRAVKKLLRDRERAQKRIQPAIP
ncbi:MAG: hypothetical protein HY656_03990 [Acidobacteria bacterium]|nr:hypothetical protein [Acidobacteriota bacterium]